MRGVIYAKVSLLLGLLVVLSAEGVVFQVSTRLSLLGHKGVEVDFFLDL